MLNDTLAATIIDLVRNNRNYTTAAREAGIGERTFYIWRARGETEINRLAAGGRPRPSESIYLRFAQDLEKARGEAFGYAVEQVRRAMPDSWQAAAWWLERTAPNEYGRANRMIVTGADGGPVEVNVTARDELVARLDEMGRRIAALPSAGDILDVEAIDEVLEA